jgi:hypothetical protein
MGPFLLIMAFITSSLWSLSQAAFVPVVYLQLGLMLSPIIDWGFKKIGLHLKLLRFASHFYLMNLALLKGFLLFSKGIESSIWEPTKRNQ